MLEADVIKAVQALYEKATKEVAEIKKNPAMTLSKEMKQAEDEVRRLKKKMASLEVES